MVGPGPAPAIRQEMGFENWPGGLRGLQSERARAPRHRQSHGTGAANVTEITAFRFAGTGPERSACDMWLCRNNPTEKNHRPVCRVECLGLLCSTLHLALRGMNHAQDFTGCSADFDDRPWSD